MKSNVPWSVKGIDPEARVVAKEAARKAGMTLGEWMTSMIHQVGEDGQPVTSEDIKDHLPATGVSADQLRAVVDSLNRLNERLTTTENQVKRSEEKTLEAANGLNLAVETVFERLKRLERERKTGVSSDIADRVEKLEQSDNEKSRIASLKSLESALSQMVEQFEQTRTEAISRVEANEQAVTRLEGRVDSLDERVTAGFQEVHDALEAVGTHLDHTERTAKAVMLEAREAAGSTDAEFVERTGKKLQLLGAEIKRSGDQITAVENMVSSLTAKIEAAERRSADGIADVSDEIDALRQELRSAGLEANEDGDEDTEDPETAAWDAVAKEAEAKVASLQATYDSLVSRLHEPQGDETPSEEPRPDAPSSPAAAAVTMPSATDSDEMAYQVPPARPDTVAGDLQDDDFDDLDSIFRAEKGLPADDRESSPAPAEDDEPAEEPKAYEAAPATVTEADTHNEPTDEETADFLDRIDSNIGRIDTRNPVDEHGQNRRLSIPLLAGLGGVLLIAVIGGTFLLGGGGDDDRGSEESVTVPSVAQTDMPQRTEPAATTPPTAAQQPDGTELYERGKQLLGTASTPSDYAEAFRLIREAAIYGNVPARYRLGELYFSGTGTAQDLQSAKRWFTEAALDGNAASMHRLGTLAVDPSVDGQNFELALEWFGRAAEYGVIDSMYNLGYLYDPTSELLRPEMRDAEKAYFWYGVAAREGDPVAPQDAENVGDSLSPSTRARIDQQIADWQPKPYDAAKNDGLQIVN